VTSFDEHLLETHAPNVIPDLNLKLRQEINKHMY